VVAQRLAVIGRKASRGSKSEEENLMNVTLSADTNQRTISRAPSGKPSVDQDAAKNERAACEFEAMLLTPALAALQKTFSGDEDTKIPGASDYQAMGTQALGEAIAARGGIGIAKLILSHLGAPKVPTGK